MAEFEKKKHAQDEFNNGNKYVANDGVQPATINNLVENSLYTEAFAESLAAAPDISSAAQTGDPTVELVDNPAAGITGAKKFKFSNLKGEQGHGYFRVTTTLETTATSVASSYVQWGGATVALASDSIVDNNGNVFAVTTKTAATSPTIPISHRTSIRGTAGADGTDGEDGDSVFVRYSASSNGANMTAAPAANTRYIGFYRGQNASNTASDYAWSQYVGKEISEVAIDEFSFVITYDDGTTSTVPLNTANCLVTYAVPADEATAMTSYLVPSNADLNDYRGENYWGKTFYAGGHNTVQNTPIAGIAFSLEVLRSGAFATTQRIAIMADGSNNRPTVFTRCVSDTTIAGGEGTWTVWTEVAEANGTYPNMTVGKAGEAESAKSLDYGIRVARGADSSSIGWYKFATIPYLSSASNYTYSGIILVNGEYGPQQTTYAAESGTIEVDVRVTSGAVMSAASGISILSGNLNPAEYCLVCESDNTASLYVYIQQQYGSIKFTTVSENAGGADVHAEYKVTYYGSTAPSGAVYAQVRNVASELAECGHRTLLWSGTCSSGSSISVSGLSNYSALYIKANSDSAAEYVMLTKGAIGLYPSLYSGNKMTIVPGVDTYWFVELFNISVSGSSATFNFNLLTLDISSNTIQKQQQSASITLTEIYGIEAFKV